MLTSTRDLLVRGGTDKGKPMSNSLIAYQRVLENGLFPYAIPYAEPKEERLELLTY